MKRGADPSRKVTVSVTSGPQSPRIHFCPARVSRNPPTPAASQAGPAKTASRMPSSRLIPASRKPAPKSPRGKERAPAGGLVVEMIIAMQNETRAAVGAMEEGVLEAEKGAVSAAPSPPRGARWLKRLPCSLSPDGIWRRCRPILTLPEPPSTPSACLKAPAPQRLPFWRAHA
jgi:hypothetical protein